MKDKLIKKLEMFAVGFLVRRGYQVTFPMIYFSKGNDKYFYSRTEQS